jgi:Xaa-Pro aminopeptidase
VTFAVGNPADLRGVGRIPVSRYRERIERARESLNRHRARALLIGVGPDLRWLTGYAAMPSERLTMLVLPADGFPTLVVPRLELARAMEVPAVVGGSVEPMSWEEIEDPYRRVVSLLPQAEQGQGSLLVSDGLWAAFLLRLEEALSDRAEARDFGLASAVLRDLRAVKDADEIALLAEAAEAADRVVAAVARGRLVGRSETDIAREVRGRLVDEGHEEASFAIIASGPNSASPHHEPGERLVQAGEPIVMDIGGTVEGYGSDITRTIWVTGEGGAGPDGEFVRLYDVLGGAQNAATLAVRAGVPCESIDEVARSAIAAADYGRYFIHRTGHGIGLEGHEDPYLVAGNTEPLRDGHVFSVEPGIYLEGRYGARIEDIVVCRENGPEVLNTAPRDLAIVRGI